MGTERHADSYTITYDWQSELFRKMRLKVNISPLSEKFSFRGLKSIITFSIYSLVVIEFNLTLAVNFVWES